MGKQSPKLKQTGVALFLFVTKCVAKATNSSGPTGTSRSDASKHRIESGHTVLNRLSPGCDPSGFKIFKTSGTHQAATQCHLIPGHHHSSSGMNCIPTVRPPCETIANWHLLCPRWRYGDSQLGHGVSRRRACVARTLAGRAMVWHGSSRLMLVKLRDDYGIRWCTPIHNKNSIYTMFVDVLIRLFELFSIIPLFRLRWG